MILGLGADIIEISRIKKVLEQHSGSFLSHVFTEREIACASDRKNQFQYYAGRWAVKEAVSKALGCGIGGDCGWQDIEVMNNPDGRPCTTLNGNALKKAEVLGVKNIQTTISHEKKYACAFVILES